MATKIKIKQSSVAGNLPSGVSTDPAYIEQGELAINTADKILYSKDSSGTIFAVTSGSGGSSSVEISDAVPTSPNDGDLWVDSASMSLNAYYADGTSSQWVGISDSTGSSGGGGFNGAMNTHIIPTADDTYDIGSASYKVRDLYLGENSLHIGGADISATNNAVILPSVQMAGHIIPDANNTYDIGSAEYKIRDLYVSDNTIYMGDEATIRSEGTAIVVQDLKTGDLHLDNTHRDGNSVDGTTGSWTFEEGENELFLLNRVNGKKYKINLTEVE
jgi:hypothetical protein